jgi:aspartyl-tRNA(Asn)/glutamyl-tRNA(Gln) amidotransferase subunit A
LTSAELAAMSAGSLALAISRGELSAGEAVRAAIARAEAANPYLNAVVSIDAEDALAAAKAIDGRRGGASRPLAGVPLAHKDMFDRVGKIASWGAGIRNDRPARRNATVIDRLHRAGAVGFAALHMAEFAYGMTGHNYHLGHCRNPHNPDHITGGSSSGPAAAVAAGLTPFSLGSDTGGSLRMPAVCCGIVGLRPTWGLVSRAGAMPLASSLDTIGPLARDVADIALALSLLAGADPADATAAAPAADYPAALTMPVKGMRIGTDRALLSAIDPYVGGLIDAALSALKEAGATEVAVAAPELSRIDRLGRIVLLAEASAVHAAWMRRRPGDYSAQVRARLEDGLAISAVDYIQALRARAGESEAVLAGPLAAADALLLPVLDRPVPTIAETDVGGGTAMAAMLGSLARFTRPVSYLGLPALALPTGKDGRGLPNGFQLVGRPYGEPALLALGAAYQRVVGVPKPVMPSVSGGGF